MAQNLDEISVSEGNICRISMNFKFSLQAKESFEILTNEIRERMESGREEIAKKITNLRSDKALDLLLFRKFGH